MKLAKCIFQIILLYGLYLIGSKIQHATQIPIPGSIIGMLILFMLLLLNIVKPEWIKTGSQLLIEHLPLLFLPVTAGIIVFADLFSGKGFLIIVLVFISTLLVMISSGVTGQVLAARKESERE